MKIGIVSDTHLKQHIQLLPKALVLGLQGVDMILHAGDWTSLRAYEMLTEIAPCNGVAGNNDPIEIIQKFQRKKIIVVAGIRIGIVHGDGYHPATEIGAKIAFTHEKPDVVVFGHSHVPFLNRTNGTIFFNPGSPTDKRKQPQYSYGLLSIREKNIHLQHFFYADKN
jgi:putative phosphoesterase